MQATSAMFKLVHERISIASNWKTQDELLKEKAFYFAWERLRDLHIKPTAYTCAKLLNEKGISIEDAAKLYDDGREAEQKYWSAFQ